MKFNFIGLTVDAFQYGVDPTPYWFNNINLSDIKTVDTGNETNVITRGDYIIRTPYTELCYATSREKFIKLATPLYDKEDSANDMKYYWSDPIRVAKKARDHVKDYEKRFKKDIADSIERSEIYRDLKCIEPVETTNMFNTQYHLMLHGTTDSVRMFLDTDMTNEHGKLAILNYASFREPGGGFISGSRAQEESLCHRSTLYNVLYRFRDTFYKDNKKELNHGLYTHATLYSPDIIFKIGDDRYIRADVITTAAPNVASIERGQWKYGRGKHITTKMIDDTIIERIDTILYIAYLNKVENIVLGPFGCGVFKNNPMVVACAMKRLLENKYRGVFRNVIFSLPIISKDTSNTVAFWNVFGK